MTPHPGRPLPAHRQLSYRVRLEWGPVGAAAVAWGATAACVVDVLSFTTAVSVAAEQGVSVLPFRWRNDRAATYAAEQGAVLALPRDQAAGVPGAVSLSPASFRQPDAPRRVVLPSPNGSTIAARLAGSGCEVVAGCLRNPTAVADHLAARLADGPVALVPAGERWPDGSLRPALEDLWGAGAIVARLLDRGTPGVEVSPEAHLAVTAYRCVADRPGEALQSCSSGRELVDAGFPEDVALSAELDATAVLPVLTGPAFTPR